MNRRIARKIFENFDYDAMHCDLKQNAYVPPVHLFRKAINYINKYRTKTYINRSMNDINPIIKKLINKEYRCRECDQHDYCEFWKGYNMPCDCCEGCFATETAEGIQIAFKHLANIPWDKAMNEIIQVATPK